MARLVRAGEFVGRFEIKAAKYLEQHLPASWVVICNKSLVRGESTREVDFIIVGEHAVFVVEEKPDEKGGAPGKTVRQQFVRLGEKRGDFVAVASGLREGETIVSTGVFKLRNGQAVVVDNTLAPEFKLAPKPEDN